LATREAARRPAAHAAKCLPLRHADRPRACLLTGEDRKWPAYGQSGAIDP